MRILFTTEHLDWGASLVGEETKWRLAAVASKPFLSNKPPFCFLGDTEIAESTEPALSVVPVSSVGFSVSLCLCGD